VGPLPGTPFGKYLLIDAIAQGGMATIHRAVLRGAAGFAKVVALKRILPVLEGDKDIHVLFQDEARIASLLGHANICQVFDFGEEKGELYLAMELVDGTDVAGLMQKRGRLPIEATLFLCSEAARGLGHAHEQKGQDGRPLGLVHRDVSPQNILVSRAGDVKITDFGIAKALGKAHRTASGVVLGKLHYMSPEQLTGGPVDARADLFSLGVILWELLTGRPLRDPRYRLEEMTTEQWNSLHATNLRSYFLTCKAASPHLTSGVRPLGASYAEGHSTRAGRDDLVRGRARRSPPVPARLR